MLKFWRKKTVKGYQYGYQMKALDMGVKNMLFDYRFSCLITFYEYKQTNVNKSQFLNLLQNPMNMGIK